MSPLIAVLPHPSSFFGIREEFSEPRLKRPRVVSRKHETVLAIANARAGRAPPGVPPLPFLLIPLTDMLVFPLFVAAAMWNRHRPETHKRLMLLATLSLLAAAVARLPTALAAAGPLFYFGVVDLLILAGVVYDLVTRRKVHPVYVWGGLALLASQVVRVALSGTSAWLTVATWLTSG